LKFLVRIENFNLTLQVESPIKYLKIVIFNCPLGILSVKPNIKAPQAQQTLIFFSWLKNLVLLSYSIWSSLLFCLSNIKARNQTFFLSTQATSICEVFFMFFFSFFLFFGGFFLSMYFCFFFVSRLAQH
jgi:hypothetical protein